MGRFFGKGELLIACRRAFFCHSIVPTGKGATLNRSLFVVAAASTLVACSSGLASTTGIGRKTRAFTQAIGDPPLPVGTPNPNGDCKNSDGSPCADIGHVTAHRDRSDPISDGMWFDWDPSDIGSTARYFGQVRRLDKALLTCTFRDGFNVMSAAVGVATFIKMDGGKVLTSATADLITYAGVMLIGGANALEFLGAVWAVLSAADLIIVAGSLGIAYWELFSLMRCAVDAYPTTS